MPMIMCLNMQLHQGLIPHLGICTPSIHSLTFVFIHSSVHSHMHLHLHWLACLITRSLIHHLFPHYFISVVWFIHSVLCSFMHSFVNSCLHLCINLRIQFICTMSFLTIGSPQLAATYLAFSTKCKKSCNILCSTESGRHKPDVSLEGFCHDGKIHRCERRGVLN